MAENSINKVISNSAYALLKNYDNEEILVKRFIEIIKSNYNLIEEANAIDIKNNNGFKINFKVIDKILDKYTNMPSLIKSKNLITKQKDVLVSTVYEKLGIVLVVFDGNPYITIEMLILSILTHNNIIFTYSSLNEGVNGLLIKLVQTLLEGNNIPKDKVLEIVTKDIKECFKSFKTINKTFIIGNEEFINNYSKLCTMEYKLVGYDSYDLYIDDLKHIETINKIIKDNSIINIYIKNNLNINIENALLVNDVDEAVSMINYNGCKYSSAIFTTNDEAASCFLNNCLSSNVLLNTSPLLVSKLNINQIDLLRMKTIYTFDMYKKDGSKVEIKG